MDTPHGVEITGPAARPVRGDPDPAGAGAGGRCCTASSTPGAGELLARRGERIARARRRRHAGLPAETRDIREDDSWRVAEPAPGLVDRRVEITGPTDRKMTINALNSGAKVWLADHEDANTPLWENVVERPAQPARRDRPAPSTSPARRARPTSSADDELRHHRRPAARLAPAGEAHPGRRRADLRQPGRLRALLLPHCAQLQLDRGKGPYFYLPKMESHLEARLWNDVFVLAQDFARHPARHDPGDRADRDLPGRVRDGGDPLRAARPLGRAQRRPLGLPVQRDQEVPHPRAATSCCPTATR